jgi:hypothetical protein
MTRPDLDRDEARLQALFDATAENPDRVQLTKLRARAADLPRRERRFAIGRLWAAFAAVLAGALIVALFRGVGRGPDGVARSALPTAHERVPAPELQASAQPAPAPPSPERPAPAPPEPSDVARAPEPAPSGSADSEATPSDREAREAVAGIGMGDDDGDWLDPLSEPAEDEVDAWLSATGAFLEDG